MLCNLLLFQYIITSSSFGSGRRNSPNIASSRNKKVRLGNNTDTDELKIAFRGPKKFRGFREGPVSRWKAPETFRARKAIFSSFVSKNRVVYTPETSCMKGTSLHL